MSEIAIGIDLGTSNSCVAVLQGGQIEVLTNAYGEPITASVVALDEDGSISVGNAAKANIIHDPYNTINSAKRLMGRYFFSEEVKKAQAICSYEICEGPNHGVRIQVRDELFSPPEIAAMVLRELKCIAEARLGQPISKAVITVPANFNDNQRQATKDAGRIAGLEVLRILNEPTAAAVSYGFGKGLNQQVAIYDLGGGTFDMSVLEIGRDVFEVLSTCGDTFLGGDDFDDRLIDLLADEFMEKEGVNLRNDPYALEKLKVAAENAKKALSVDDTAEIRIPDIIAAPDGSTLSLERIVSAAEFSSLVNDLIQRTFKVCDEALQQAGVIARDLDGVILVGGPTRLPVIRDAVRDYFQQDPKTDVDPDQVVAMGAAIHAATLVDSEREAFLLDVTPLSLRIGVAGGLAESIIERNTPVPIEQTRTFTTFQDHQESVVIRVYQGESRSTEDNELLGQFEFSGFKRARRGEVHIDVTFEIDADGIVAVIARDPDTGQEASTRITLSSGLSEREVSDIIEQRRTDRVQSATPENAEELGKVALVTKAATQIPQTKEAISEAPPLPLPPNDDLIETPAPPPPPAPVPDLPEPEPAAKTDGPEVAVTALLEDDPPTAEVELETDALDVDVELEVDAEIEIEVGAAIETGGPGVAALEPDTELAGIGDAYPEIELETSAEPEPIETGQAPAPLPSEAPTDELRAYEDDLIEDLDLVPEVELDLVDEAPVSERVTQVDEIVSPPAEPESDAEPDKTLFEAAGTDLSELPGDAPEKP